MVPISGEWSPFADLDDKLEHYRLWGLTPPKSKKLRPVMVVDGYFDAPEPCEVVGYQRDTCAVIKLADGYHAIYGEYLAELQPVANQKLPFGVCFAEVLADYVVFDIETTGLNRTTDRIIEISAAHYMYGRKVDVFSALVNPGVPIPASITKLTGITQTDVDGAPPLEAVAPKFLEFIGELPLVGHNAKSFDAAFVSAQFGVELQNPVIDTLPMAREAFPLLPCHKLEYMNKVLGLGSTVSHRALADAETTNALMWACLAPRKYEAKVNKAFLDNIIGANRTESNKEKTGTRKAKKPEYQEV